MTTPQMSFGQRLRLLRERAGKTRPVLGGLVGRSADWVKALENGRLLTPRLPLLLRLAEALDVTDLAELTGTRPIPVASVSKAGHTGTEAVAEAMRQGGHPDQSGPLSVDLFRSHVEQAWHLWHRSSAERTAVAAILPDLIREARSNTRVAEGPLRRRALVEQARTYHLAQLFLAHQPAAELVWLAADRAMCSAQDADAPAAVAAAAWYYAHVYRSGGEIEAAEHVLAEAVQHVNPQIDVEALALWGQLHLGLALTHAKAGRGGKAMHHWDMAENAARSLGPGYVHPWLMFGAAAVSFYRVTIEADLFRLGEAAQLAVGLDYTTLPSRTRRAGHLVDAARVHQLRRQEVGTVHLLERAMRQSVDVVRYNPFARTAVLELMHRPGTVGQDARELALAVGIEG